MDKIIFLIRMLLLIAILFSFGHTQNLFIHYGLMAGYQLSWITLSGEILGLAGVTETYSSFGERFDHSTVFAANFRLGRMRPSLFYQFQ